MEFLLFRHTLAIDFNYLVFNILSVLFLLFVFLSFKKVATIVHNATTVGAYEKSMLIENTISEFLRSTKKIETLTPDFRFSNFERNLFLAFMLIILVPVALSGDSETIKRAVIQITNGQPGYKEFEYFESSNENLIEANENLAGSSSFLDRVNYLLAFGERRHVIKLDVSATPNKVSRQKPNLCQ